MIERAALEEESTYPGDFESVNEWSFATGFGDDDNPEYKEITGS